MARWYLGRYVRVLTPTGKWEFMRVVEATRLYLLVQDAGGGRYIIGRKRAG